MTPFFYIGCGIFSCIMFFFFFILLMKKSSKEKCDGVLIMTILFGASTIACIILACLTGGLLENPSTWNISLEKSALL